ncbi:unnamed protein product [Medioppia subpectinata]|uniref:Uncharacterized protein n=1 Tax=Medioppia subpectinata TaxID=1979941 RepID=A0A7R9KK24_9ACAR|nr:unnamed protein product [Medioppia subpectinata]CAG2104765.1 unnamed protein product [Medioppia subpectinata]
MSNLIEEEVNENLLNSEQKNSKKCVPIRQDPSSSLLQWPEVSEEVDTNIELQTLHQNQESTASDMLFPNESLMSDRLRSGMDSTPESSDKRIAAQVKNVVFSYGRGKKAVNALNGITINVPEGNILKPRKGTVIVFGEQPGSYDSLVPGPGVGYMPQEIGLFQEFTIEETLTFFGRLYRLPKVQIKNSIRFLLQFLDLPDKTSSVAKLSGGQKRRVSLAAALVHKPPLLVLDEPTVGIDPVLRQSIWKHLIALAKDGITVIITTHYIEEARNANIVAFIRQGMLLEEGNPETLIKRQNLHNLEDVFLRLCNNKESDLNIYDKSQGALFFLCLGRDPYDIPVAVFNGELKPKYSTGFLQNIDNYTITQKQYNTFESGYESVKNGDNKALIYIGANFSKALVQRGLQGYETDTETIDMSSIKLYLDMTSQFSANKIRQTLHESYQTFAKAILKSNDMPEAMADPPIHIEDPILGTRDPPVTHFMAPGFILSLAFFCAIATSALSLVLERKDGLLERSLVSGVHPNEYILSHVLTQTMVVILQTFSVLMIAFLIFEIPNRGSILWVSVLIVMQGVCGMAYGILISAITKEENFTLILCMGSMFPQFLLSGVVWPSRDPPVTHFMAPGFILSLAFFCAIATSALSLVLERKDGLLERSLVSGVHPNEYILSHVLTQTMVVILQTFSVLMIAFLIFEIPNRGSILWVSVLIVMQGVCGMAYGILISAITKEENFTLILCMGSMFPQFLLSGVVWPVETMPKILIFISTVFSQAKSIEAVRYMLYRGWGLDYFEVYLGFIISGSWTIVFLCVAAIMFNVNKSR